VAGAHRQDNSESERMISLADLLGQPTIPGQREHHSPPATRRRRPGLPWLLAGVVIALAAIGTGTVMLTGHAQAQPRLALTTARVAIGHTYFATATGFLPREQIRFSWTGPTNGVMGAFPADPTGASTHGPILERDPVGNYEIIATGLTSGHVASTPLQVLPPG
jgi:hypothetical protein